VQHQRPLVLDLRHQSRPRRDRDVQFLHHFPNQRFGLAFPRLDAAARKAPHQRRAFHPRTSNKQESFVTTNDTDDSV